MKPTTPTCGECAKAEQTCDPDLVRCENPKSPYCGFHTDKDSAACPEIVRKKCILKAQNCAPLFYKPRAKQAVIGTERTT